MWKKVTVEKKRRITDEEKLSKNNEIDIKR